MMLYDTVCMAGVLMLVGGEGHSIFYTGFLDNTSTNGHLTPDRAASPISPNGSTTLPAK